MEDRCIVCGEIIPEGGQLCRNCFLDSQEKLNLVHDIAELTHYFNGRVSKNEKDQSIKADAGKPQLRLVPTEIINCIARVREFGNKKYGDSNSWRRVEKERYVDAMFRHLLKYINDNKSVDEESGLPHLWHCATNIAFLCEMDKE